MQAVQFPGSPPWSLHQGYGHGERIFDVAFHPFNDDLVLTASEDSSVRMWRRPEGSGTYRQVRAFLGHSGEVLRACWSGNGLLLASGSADRTVRLWAADLNDQGYTGRQLAVLDGHPEEVYHVELVTPVSPPPDLAAVRRAFHSASDAGGVQLPPFETHVLVASSESLFVWSLQEGAVMQQADAPGTSGSTITQEAIMAGARPSYIFGVSRQPHGTLVAAACCDGVVRLWSLRPTGRLEWAGQIALPGQPMLTGCAFAADGTLLGVCSREGRLIEVDVRTLDLLSSRQLPSSPLSIAHLPAGGVAAEAAAGATADATAGVDAAKQPQPLWLVACRDGAVYGYLTGQQDGGHPCVLRPPAGPGVAVLSVAVSPGGTAVALGGEAQDAALLPQVQTSCTSARPGSGSAAASEPLGGEKSSSAGPSGRSGAGESEKHAEQQAARRAVTAPPRRRGGGAGRVVAGGLATRDPLALFDGVGVDGTDGVEEELGAMTLTDTATVAGNNRYSSSSPGANPQISPPAASGTGSESTGEGGGRAVAEASLPSAPQRQQQQQQEQRPRSRGAVLSGATGDDVSMGEPSVSAGATGQRQQPEGLRGFSPADGDGIEAGTEEAAANVALSGLMRAPLFVYLGPEVRGQVDDLGPEMRG